MEIKLTNASFQSRKLLLKFIMRTFIFLCCTTVFGFSPSNIVSQNSRVVIEESQLLTVDEVFDLVMEQTDYKFFYEEDLFKDFAKIRVKKGEIKINKLLERSLSQGNLDVKMTDNNAILISIKSVEEKDVIVEQPQTHVVSGVVTDKTGMPLPGVNIIVKESKKGVVSDFDGNFSIQVSTGETLSFSYLGFKIQEILVDKQNTLNVVLIEDATQLDQVVVVGFGSQVKGEISGAISNVSADDLIKSNPVANVSNLLQGALPGLVVTRSGGQPGREGYNLLIRDATSVNSGNGPLILVDGVEGSIGGLNPSDIASFNILKDASAAIYGSRASSGVILITTKKGKRGKPVFELNTAITFKSPQATWNQPTLLQYANMHREAEMNEGRATPWWFPNQYYDKLVNGTGVAGEDNWAQNLNNPNGRRMFYKDSDLGDNLFSNSLTQNYNFSVSGGTEKTTYRFSIGYNRDEGVFSVNNNLNKKYNVKMSNQWNITDWLSIDARIGLEKSKLEEPTYGLNALARYSNANPMQPTYNSVGDYLTWGGFLNPLQQLEAGNTERRITTFRINLTNTLKLAKGLKFVNQIAFNESHTNQERTSISYEQYHWTGATFGGLKNDPNNVEFFNAESLYSNISNYLEYKKTISDEHNFGLTIGNVNEGTNFRSFDATAYNIIGNEIFHLPLGDPDTKENSSVEREWKIASYFARLNYNYNGKYFLEVVGRRDGSSKFSPENRWGNFGGVSAAWKLSNENFISNLNIFDDLKLRASIGETGNERIGGNDYYNYIQNIAVGGQVLFGASTIESRANLDGIPATDALWETVVSKNIGLDFTLLNNRLSGSIDIYKKTNTDMLISEDFPEILGALPPKVNNGELTVNGYEIGLRWNDKIGDFNYHIGGVFFDSRNKITKVGSNIVKTAGLNNNLLGYSTNTYLGYKFGGIIKTQEQLDTYKLLSNTHVALDFGDVMWEDVDGNGRIDPFGDEGESGDLVNLGTTNPRYNYSVDVGGSWKNFDIGLYFNGVGKKTIIASGGALPYEGARARWHKPNAMYYEWGYTQEFVDNTGRVIVEARDTDNPRVTLGPTASWNWKPSKLRAWNGAYLRLKNVSLGYTLPKGITERIKLTSLRLYVNANDVVTFHNVPGGYDPEQGNVNREDYPLTKGFVFGVQVKF